MMRVVLDANVFISALLSPNGVPAQILTSWEEKKFELIMSLTILEELDRVLHYPKLQGRYHLPEEKIRLLLRLLQEQTTIVSPTAAIGVIEQDPTDNIYLECAISGSAHVIVSGDQHLLRLKEYRDVQILTPIGFMTLLKLGD